MGSQGSKSNSTKLNTLSEDIQDQFRRKDEFDFGGGVELVLEHYISFKDKFEGLKLWEGAIVMTKYLLAHPKLVENKEVMDLGCGMGVLGIALAKKLSIKISMTDYLEKVLRLAKTNLDANQPLVGQVEVENLDWNNSLGYSKQFDVIIGCELVYSITSSENLCSLLKKIIKPNGVLLMMIPTCRAYGPAFLENLKKIGNFDFEEKILEKEKYCEDPMVSGEDLFYPLKELEFRMLIARKKE